MTFLTPKMMPWFALCISAGLLLGAWFFQYVLGYPPCQMCYWQRHAHKAVIVVAIMALIFNHFGFGNARLWVALLALAFLISAGLAFWHVGVEYKWWEGPKTCMTGTPGPVDFDPNTFFDNLDKPKKLPGCDEALWHFLGISMAGWNTLISIFGLTLSGLSVKRASNV